LPNWILQAPDDFVKGLIDGYFSGDGSVSKEYDISASSVSESLINQYSLLLSRFGIFSVLSNHLPDKSNFKSVSKVYHLYIPRKYAKIFATHFTLTLHYKQERLNQILKRENIRCNRKDLNNIVWDKVKSIKETKPIHGWMYDVTVEKTHNFLTANGINMYDKCCRKQEA
jgi:intein/homing endonuclease